MGLEARSVTKVGAPGSSSGGEAGAPIRSGRARPKAPQIGFIRAGSAVLSLQSEPSGAIYGRRSKRPPAADFEPAAPDSAIDLLRRPPGADPPTHPNFDTIHGVRSPGYAQNDKRCWCSAKPRDTSTLSCEAACVAFAKLARTMWGQLRVQQPSTHTIPTTQHTSASSGLRSERRRTILFLSCWAGLWSSLRADLLAEC